MKVSKRKMGTKVMKYGSYLPVRIALVLNLLSGASDLFHDTYRVVGLAGSIGFVSSYSGC